MFKHIVDKNAYEVSTKEMKEILNGVPLNTPEVMVFVNEYIKENMQKIYGGVEQ